MLKILIHSYLQAVLALNGTQCFSIYQDTDLQKKMSTFGV